MLVCWSAWMLVSAVQGKSRKAVVRLRLRQGMTSKQAQSSRQIIHVSKRKITLSLTLVGVDVGVLVGVGVGVCIEGRGKIEVR